MSNWKPLGEFIEQCDERNSDGTYDVNAVRGISIDKKVIPTKANMEDVSLTPYKLFKPKEFCFVTITSRNGGKISLACNEDQETHIVSSSYEVFRIKDHDQLDPGYLSMLFRRAEFDRYARFNSWGSAREAFSYADMTRVRIPVPRIEVQRSVVAAWQGLREMQAQNERLAETLMPLCRSYLQDLKHKYKAVEIGPYLELCDETNTNSEDYPVVGINKNKEFMPTVASLSDVDTKRYKIIKKGRFVFSGMQTGRDICIRLGLFTDEHPALMSPAYTTFELKKDTQLLPDYLFMFFKRDEMDRLGWFYSDSSVRSNLDWGRFVQIKIPLPPIEVQRAIVEVFRAAQSARRTAERAAALSKGICPALIQRAIHS